MCSRGKTTEWWYDFGIIGRMSDKPDEAAPLLAENALNVYFFALFFVCILIPKEVRTLGTATNTQRADLS